MILLIDNNDSFTYNIVELLSQVTDKKIVLIKNDELRLADVEDCEKAEDGSFYYRSVGGITLLSNVKEEYDELIKKV